MCQECVISQYVTEIVDLRSVEWLLCSRRAKKFVPLDSTPSTIKSKGKHSLKHFRSSEHSIKAYADDATLISDCLQTHTRVLQTIDNRAKDLDLSFKPVKCVSYLFDGSQHRQLGIELSGGTTRSITEGSTKFLGKFLGVSSSATKKAANGKMCDLLSQLLSNEVNTSCGCIGIILFPFSAFISQWIQSLQLFSVLTIGHEGEIVH